MRLAGGETIDDTNNAGTYSLNGEYTQPIVIEITGTVTINITGKVDYTAEASRMLQVKSGTVTVNGSDAYTVDASTNNGGFMELANGTTAVIKGGVYKAKEKECFYNDHGNLTLDNVKANVEHENIVFAEGGTTTVKGGKYANTGLNAKRPAFHNLDGSILTMEKVTVSSEATCVSIGDGCEGTIIGGSYSSSGTTQSAIGSRGTITLRDVTVNSPETGSVLAQRGICNIYGGIYTAKNDVALYCVDATTSVKDAVISGRAAAYSYGNGKTTFEGCTLKDGERSIWVASGEVVLKNSAFENNQMDIYLNAGQTITIDENYTGIATVGCADAAENRKITTEDTEDYQPKWKLVSADDAYIVDYKKDETTGEEYRYLKTRDENSFVVAAENATATAALPEGEKELYSFTQVPAGTEVTLTADAPDEGWVFTGWQVTKGSVTLEDTATATFEMPTSDVVVSAQYEYRGTDSTEGASAGGAAAAVVVGAAAAWGVYEAGTGIYRMVNMKGIPMPANRGELALLIWEHAGKPEPAGDALYADIDADNTDLQKAAHWAVEQDLMDEKANNNFKPGTYVTKLRTCVTWDKAKQKGLFD